MLRLVVFGYQKKQNALKQCLLYNHSTQVGEMDVPFVYFTEMDGLEAKRIHDWGIFWSSPVVCTTVNYLHSGSQSVVASMDGHVYQATHWHASRGVAIVFLDIITHRCIQSATDRDFYSVYCKGYI